MGYILFSSEDKFMLYAPHACWDGIIEYSYDNQIWDVWNGYCINNNRIYMRGINNVFRWILDY